MGRNDEDLGVPALDLIMICGIILAGGRSTRMNGEAKAFLDLGGRSLLAHVLGRLAPQCHGLVLSANTDAARFASFGVPVVADDISGFAGPVAGLVAALDWIADAHPHTDKALSCAVDTPFIPSDLGNRLHEAARRGGTPAACAVSGGRRHPVAALWPVAARHEIRYALLNEGRDRLSEALEALGRSEAAWPIEPFDPFFNINTPADLHLARGFAEGGIGP